ncbi:MAG: hypothetical protein AAGB93_02545 [Planctomycetota bacterium]
MLLPTLALALQVTPVQYVADAHASETAQGVVHHALVLNGLDASVFGRDAAGQLVQIATLEGPVTGALGPAVSGTRVVALEPEPGTQMVTLRVWERGPSQWRRGPELGVQFPFLNFRPRPLVLDVDDDRAVVVLTGTSVAIHDVRTDGQAPLEALIPITAPHYVRDVAIDGDVIALLQGDLPDPNGPLTDLQVRILQRGPGGWFDAGALDLPPGVDLDRSRVDSIDAHGGRIVVGAPWGPNGDAGGRVFVYERTPSGSYELDAVLRSESGGALTPDRGTGFGTFVRLAGDELAVNSTYPAEGQRFERTSAGWTPRERVVRHDRLFPFGGRLLGNRDGRPRLFEPVSDAELIDVVCPALAPSQRSVAGFNGVDASVRRFVWTAPFGPSPDVRFFLVGTEEARRPLGPAAELCLGAPFSVFPVAADPLSSNAVFTLDLTQLGLPAGTSVHVQGWRREPVDPGGLTTAAFSVSVPN